MIPDGARQRWAACAGFGVVCLAIVLVAGCGSNGGAGVTFPGGQPSEPLTTGIVSMPIDQGAFLGPLQRWAGSLHLFGVAYGAFHANPNVFPTSGLRVTLSRVNPLDATDGVIGNNPGISPLPLGQPSDTDDSGRYTINKDETVDSVDGCGFMVAVGNQQSLTRAFVLASAPAETNIDVVSETVVRVVLHRVSSQSPPVQLCDFSTLGLVDLTDAVSNAVFTATGADAEEINQNAFDLAIKNNSVKAAVDAATGVPVSE